MKKNYTVSIEDNGAAFLVVIGKGTENRLVVGSFSTLGDAWKHIQWMYEIESQDFNVGKMSVKVWVHYMKESGYLED